MGKVKEPIKGWPWTVDQVWWARSLKIVS